MTDPLDAEGGEGRAIWRDALAALVVLAVGVRVGGIAIRARAGPVRDALVEQVRAMSPEGVVFRRLPLSVDDDRLLGGLDLTATLAAGRPVLHRGLLADVDGGILMVAMAERLPPARAALIADALETGAVQVERDGFSAMMESRFRVLAFDEGIESAEGIPRALQERLGLWIDLEAVSLRDIAGAGGGPDAGMIAAARDRLAVIEVADEVVPALVGASEAFGVASLRAPVAALACARALAALEGAGSVEPAHLATAVRLAIMPRATRLPAETEAPEPPAPAPANPDPAEPAETRDQNPSRDEPKPIEDMIVEAAQALMPERLLASLAMAATGKARAAGRAGQASRANERGRPTGARRAVPRSGQRIALVDTLRAAAPWQALRRGPAGDDGARIHVRKEDFHTRRFRHRSRTTTLFVVDASGSAAMHRLAEAKGAVELLLAECYVRRDQVALISFRGTEASVALPPTRSLVRAKRTLAGMAGGGATPLAAAIDLAGRIADQIRRDGGQVVVVFLTDGRANMDRSGSGDRTRAHADALQSARLFSQARITTLFVDTSPRPQEQARDIAASLGATYLPLPHGAATKVAGAVRTAAA